MKRDGLSDGASCHMTQIILHAGCEEVREFLRTELVSDGFVF